MKQIDFSIIMPSYNSERTIGLALQSIRMQDFDQNCIEILVIDGGSTDATIDIAKHYGARVINNPQRYPEYAKKIGFREARGRWIIKQDSDEVYLYKDQISRRKLFFEKNKEVYCLLVDTLYPGEDCGIASTYLNWFGDPFSYIVYRLHGSIIAENKKYLVEKGVEGNVYRYKREDIKPIGDGGTTTIDFQKAKELFGDAVYSQEFAASCFDMLVTETEFAGCIPGDSIKHYSKADFKTYLKKLRFKIHLNVNASLQSGYNTKASRNQKLKMRKILFVLYALFFLLPICDSVLLAFKYRKANLILHFVYTYYVIYFVFVETIKKWIGVENKGYTYG